MMKEKVQRLYALDNTDVSDAMLEKLPLFIDMTIIEFVIDEFECCAREGGELNPEDIRNAVYCLVNDIPYGGFGEKFYGRI